MSIRLRELQDLERFLTLKGTIGDAALSACLAALETSDHPAGQQSQELLRSVSRLGPAHLLAIQELKEEEKKKGVFDFVLSW